MTVRSLVTFTAVRHMSSTRSTASTKAMASTGKPTAPKMRVMATKLAAGMPATPMEVSSASSTTVNCCTNERSNPITWAMNITTTHS